MRAFALSEPKLTGLALLYWSARYLRDGRNRILAGDLQFTITWQGKPCDYVEARYLDANPDVAQLVASGAYKAGIDHFIEVGIHEVLAGKRDLYSDRARPALVSRIEGTAERYGKTVCLFAHYDPQSLVDPYVVTYLKALRAMGCDLVFVSGSILDSEVAKLSSLCGEILIRNPIGYDFTSWYIGIRHSSMDFARYETVLLVNDSTYFPLRPVDKLLETMGAKGYEFWGLSDSYQDVTGSRYHVQSFFMALTHKAVSAGMLERYALRFEEYGSLSRRGYIEAFEYGISGIAKDLGLSMGAYCSLEDAYEASSWTGKKRLKMEASNPSIHLWREMLSVCGCPALKVALIRDNPEGYFDWADLERLNGDYDLELIRAHLKRVGGF